MGSWVSNVGWPLGRAICCCRQGDLEGRCDWGNVWPGDKDCSDCRTLNGLGKAFGTLESFSSNGTPGVPIWSLALWDVPQRHIPTIYLGLQFTQHPGAATSGFTQGRAVATQQVQLENQSYSHNHSKAWLNHASNHGSIIALLRERKATLSHQEWVFCLISFQEMWLCCRDVLLCLLFLEEKGLYKGKIFVSSLVFVSCWSCGISH